MKKSPKDYLENLYKNALDSVGSGVKIQTDLSKTICDLLQQVLDKSESSKAVLTVLLTSLTYKSIFPAQDIRNHQSSISGGYSGRTFDNTVITPFMKKMKFPAMAESGWLTRSLEQKVPYDFNYPGAINPKNLKLSFLTLLDFIEKGEDCEKMILWLFQGLILKRNEQEIDLAKPMNLPIRTIIQLLLKHFNAIYHSEGAARLPVIALYAVYKCLISEIKRFHGKTLESLENHTTSDKKSGRLGDIEISDEKNRPFEAVEIKHGIALNLQLLEDAFEKFSKTQVKRFYLLSTNEQIEPEEQVKIAASIERIKNIHGCQVIVNGLIKTLNYYLRLLEDPAIFIEHYVNLIETDSALKFEHKQMWNKLISEM
jgi:DNA (cytosine-5)-methyltransferase 1